MIMSLLYYLNRGLKTSASASIMTRIAAATGVKAGQNLSHLSP
jgi:hypothetical protein